MKSRADVLDPPGSEEFPRWLTLREASFLTGLDEASLRVLVVSGQVGCDRSLSRKLGDGYLLLPSKDLRDMGVLHAESEAAVEESEPDVVFTVAEAPAAEAPTYPATKAPRTWPRPARRWAIGSVLAVLVVASFMPLLRGWQSFAVDSGRMAPSVRAGDLVLDRAITAGAIRPGDVITLVDPATGRSRTTRVRTIEKVGTYLRLEVRADRETDIQAVAVPALGSVDRVDTRISWIGGPLSRLPGHLDRHASLLFPGLALLVALIAWGIAKKTRRPA